MKGKGISFGRQTFQTKSREDFIAAHDSAVIVQPMQAAKRAELVKVLSWTPDCGPAPLIWSAHPVGYKCLFSCWWQTKEGGLMPDSYALLDQLKVIEIISEAEDRAFHDPQGAANTGLSQSLLAWLSFSVADSEYALDCIKKALGKMRPGQEYSAFWSLPQPVAGGFVHDIARRGWPEIVRKPKNYFADGKE